MKIKYIYKKQKAENYKLKFEFDRKSESRPAWIKVIGLPKGVNFIQVHLGKEGMNGQRIQSYKTYLPEGLFLPIDYNNKEMQKFYDRWSEDYDNELQNKNEPQNLHAANFLLGKVKKYLKKGEMLDLGAGTGCITEIFAKVYNPATLVDFSCGMLSQAKKRKGLEGCAFIKEDIRKLKLNKQYDLVMSMFSFGSSSYFKSEEIPKILGIVEKHLKKKGVFAVLGHFENDIFRKKFRTLETGIYVLDKKREFYTDYFIGKTK